MPTSANGAMFACARSAEEMQVATANGSTHALAAALRVPRKDHADVTVNKIVMNMI